MDENESRPARRLNPFALPPDTNTRFGLLVVAALILTFNMVMLLSATLGLDLHTGNLSFIAMVVFAALHAGFALTTLAVAAIIYRAHPTRIKHNDGLLPVPGDKDPWFSGVVQGLVNLSGLSTAPEILMSPASKSADGQAFGLTGRYFLRLGGRLPLLLRQKPGHFKAIVLHELAHIFNGDIGRTYFAQGLWAAVIFITIIPAAILIALQLPLTFVDKLAGGISADEWKRLFVVNIPTVLIMLLQFGGTLALVAAIRSSLLRVREFYADWRAALWGAAESLTEILKGHSSSQRAGPFWSRIWGLHPSARDRLDVLQDPDQLFVVKNGTALFVGISLGLILDGLITLGFFIMLPMIAGMAGVGSPLENWLLSGHAPPLIIDSYIFISKIVIALIALIPVALGNGMTWFVAGALGVDVQREALADMSMARRGWRPYLSLWKPAVLLAVGFQVGLFLAPGSYAVSLPALMQNFQGLLVILIVLARILLLTIAVAFLTWLWLVYARYFTVRTLGVHVSHSSPDLTRRVSTLTLAGLLFLLYLPVFFEYFLMWEMATVDGMKALQSAIWDLPLLAVALFLYFGVFAGSWIVVQALSTLRQPRCPSCGHITDRPFAVGQLCETCGKDLAPWLYVS